MQSLTRTATLTLGTKRPTRADMVEVGNRHNVIKCAVYVQSGMWYAKVTYPNPDARPVNNMAKGD